MLRDSAAATAGTSDPEVGILVYNAGAVHGTKKSHDQPIEHALGLVHLNCREPVLLAHRFGGTSQTWNDSIAGRIRRPVTSEV